MKIPHLSFSFNYFLAVILVGGFIFSFSAQPAYAIPVTDISASIWRTVEKAFKNAGSKILNNVLRTTLNQIAYDYATYLGSGGAGQKPLFATKPLSFLIQGAGQSAVGQFLEEITNTPLTSKDGTTYGNLNLCQPDFFTLQAITLGIANEARPEYDTGLCTFKELENNWKNDIEAKRQYLTNVKAWDLTRDLSGYFSSGGSDVSIAFGLFNKAYEEKITAEKEEQDNFLENQGWLRITSPISGKYLDAPNQREREAVQINELTEGSFWAYTGDVLVDAANIFMNQLALTAFNKLMNKIGSLSDNNDSSSLANPNFQANQGGVAQVNRGVSQILKVQVGERSDYNILSQLISCTDEANPGPTNCVLDNDFAKAIESQMTISQAVSDNLLDPNKRIGFNERGDEMSYLDGYPYRSLIILRKYRVLPVGWEVAAQYIKTHPQDTKDVTLKKLLECFDDQDIVYNGYKEDWCRGLIDPNWVLKIPKMYCGMEGYGPEITYASINPSNIGYCAKTDTNCSSGGDTEKCASNFEKCTSSTSCGDPNYPVCNFTVGRDVTIVRNSAYCADEQSCLKENVNGSCAGYGYCTEEERRWVFYQQKDNSCEAVNNTCQTFKNDSGTTASYLENTLDYANCGANQVGCKQYVTNGTYTSATETSSSKMVWNNTSSLYFNKNIADCDYNNEGCHQFIRTKDDLDTNLMADGGFELSSCLTDINIQNETLLPTKNKLVKQALAQASQGGCQIETLNSSGYLRSPNNRWYIRVNSGSVKAGIVNENYNSDSQSLYIEGAGGIYSLDNGTPSLLPAGFIFETERFYTLSVQVYVEAGKVKAGFGSSTTGQSAETTETGKWQNLIITYYRPANGANDFYIEGVDNTAKFYVDDIKLAVGDSSFYYNDYFTNNVVYQKLLPTYLESLCYKKSTTGTSGGGEPDGPIGSEEANYEIKDDAPQECYNYARKCNASEVGCETYTSLDTGMSITAKIKPKDVCPETCLGYDVFVEQPTYFSVSNSNYFIPSSAKACSAQSVGCTAFTNLDKLEQGGEAIEYYSYLRSCIKPDTLSCGEFYTWEGSDEAGYQLRVFSLKKYGNEPASTMSPEQEALVCNETIFKKSPYEPGYNYDCREFYNRTGEVSYHLYTRTITCSDDCHPYRREVANSQECTTGGGTWDTTQGGRCLYYAIASEGTTCSASEVNCREYTGNVAGNVNIILNNTFENTDNPTDDWSGGSQSNTSLNLGGHSLLGINLSKVVGDSVKQNESYTISFLAKAQINSVSISNIALVNKDEAATNFSITNTIVGSEWKLYTFNLSRLDHEVSPLDETVRPPTGESLVINFSGPAYIDNLRLVEVPNRHFLIKNSWTTPEECDQTIIGQYAPRYMLGCSKYKDRSNTEINLHSFSQLCQDSAAGCEQMIDTYNSANYKKALYNDTNANGSCDSNEPSCVMVPADRMINVVYDKAKQCGQENKGCQRLGLASTYDNATIYSDVYKKNNPDQYNTVLCNKEAVGCSQWTNTTGGISYFKDPGEMVCEWREHKTTRKYEWLKKKVKRCNGTGTLCNQDGDCSSGQVCKLDDEDRACDITYDKTVGRGGSGNKTKQPANWVGVCSAQQAGCTEYIDPISKFNENLILNPDYKNLDTDLDIEYWQTSGTQATQSITLQPQTIYILKGAGNDNQTKVKLSCSPNSSDDRLRVLDSSNNFSPLMNNNNPVYETPEVAGGIDDNAKSLEFYFQSSAEIVNCIVTRTKIDPNETIFLRKAIVEYQLAQNLDRTSPNGIVSLDSGFVLFNERAQTGASKKSLVYNADETYDTPPDGLNPKSNAPLNANVILKVKPDRSCAKWLACLTYIPDPSNASKKICLDVGLCDKLGPDGSCAHFVNQVDKQNQSQEMKISNLSGYSKVGYVEGSNSTMLADYYNLSTMSQVGEKINIENGNFESNSSWDLTTGSGAKIVNQPNLLQDFNFNPFHVLKDNNSRLSNSSYLPPEGRGVLVLPTGSKATQVSPINLVSGQRYVITFYAYNKGDGLVVKMETNGQGGFVLNGKCSNSGNYCYNGSGCGQGEACITIKGDVKNQWVKHTIGFKASAPSYYLVFDKSIFGSGDAYIDDVRIEPGLNYRCSDSTNSAPPLGEGEACSDPTAAIKPNFIGSSCRLYARENSLACAYFDTENIYHKGIYGYCLEPDPRDQSSCLLWYPVSRIAGDQDEEGSNVNFGSDSVYYCIEAKDDCNASVPYLYCNKFVKVDKEKYWNKRMSIGSTFKMPDPPNFPVDPIFTTTTMKMDLGINSQSGQTINIPGLNINSGAYQYYGSYRTDQDLNGYSFRKIMEIDNNQHNSFIPYYGSISRKLCSDNNGPWEAQTPENSDDADVYIGARDNCYVYSAWEWNRNGYREDISPCPACGNSCNSNYYWDYEANCDEPDAQCSFNQGYPNWQGHVHDSGADSNDSGCSFLCYYHAQSMSVAKGINEAEDAIRRIFIGNSNWKYLTWNTISSKYEQQNVSHPYSLTPCNGTGNGPRPGKSSIVGNNQDYCYINPQLSNLKVNGVSNSYTINGSGNAALSFETKTDVEQLPIKEIVINWGYKDNVDIPVKTTLGPNLADVNPRYVNHFLDYFIINNGHNDCPGNTCTLNVSVKITDNWGYSHTSPNYVITVKKPEL